MRAARWLWLCLVVIASTFGCKNLLGIEERTLDVTEINENGYDGCRPATSLCTSCTSQWHTCICEGWSTTPEIELRNKCAEQAPAEIRRDVEEAARERYQVYISDLDGEGYDGCVPDDGECDECLNDWHECLCEDWEPSKLPEVRADCAQLSPDPIRDQIEEEAEEDLRDFLREQVGTDAADGTDVDATDTDVDLTDGDISELARFNEDFCDSQPDDDDCLECFCAECANDIAECQAEFGCASIADCFLGRECDPFADTGTMACVDPTHCGAVVSEFPASLPRARSLFDCAQNEECPCEEPSAGPLNCNPEQGCNSCPDCWSRCFCEGKNDGQCQDECGSPSCTSDDACGSCNDCLDYCFCEGLGDRAYCMGYCQPGGADCVPERGCECDNCFDACLCTGSTFETCENECGLGNQTCDPFVSCDGCMTCGGACYCDDSGAPFSECMLGCEIEGCEVDNCGACSSCQTQCECGGDDPLDCLQQCTGVTCGAEGFTDCERCSCDRCTSLFGECEQHEACIDLMLCFEQTGCFDIADCDRPEFCRAQIDVLGLGHPLLGVVEALQACRLTQGCACFGGFDPNLPPEIQCGDVTCVPFVPPPPDPIAGACCTGSDGGRCGIEAGPIFGPEHDFECLPMGGDGFPTADCPGQRPTFAPYNDESQLDGCCTPEGTCGFIDDRIGLGCVPPEYFGVPADAVITCDASPPGSN